jgi:hypothetical protein
MRAYARLGHAKAKPFVRPDWPKGVGEMSMLASPIFNLVLFRLQQFGGFPDIKTMLKHKLVVLVGDHAQVCCFELAACSRLYVHARSDHDRPE